MPNDRVSFVCSLDVKFESPKCGEIAQMVEGALGKQNFQAILGLIPSLDGFFFI